MNRLKFSKNLRRKKKLLPNVPQLENHPVYLSYEASEDFSECICLPCRSTSQARHSHSSPYTLMTPAKEVVAFLLVKIPFLSVCCTRGNLNARFQSIPLSLSLYSLNFFKQISLRSDYSNAIFYLLINYTRQFFFCHPKFSGSRSNTYFVSFLEISNFNDAYRTS